VPGQQTSCLLIEKHVLVDAGGVTAKLSVDEQANIDHVVISHAHLDHVYDLAFLADNGMAMRSSPLRVWAPAEVLNVLREHLFNDKVWPDLTQLEIGGFPVLELCPLAEGGKSRVGPLDIGWVRTNHTVFSAGYLLEKGNVSVLYSGDTTATDELWQLGRSAGRLNAVFVEASFPDRLEALAVKTGHLTPSLLSKELVKLDKPEVPVKIFHMKPQYLDEIRSDLMVNEISCQILQGNEQFEF
jgi:cAMP phosphodiesterase